MSARTFFDSNVLVYLFDEDSPAKQAQARELFAEDMQHGRRFQELVIENPFVE